MSTTAFENMTLEEMQAAYTAMRAKLAEVKADEQDRIIAAVSDSFGLAAEDLVAHTDERVSATSGWQGYSQSGVPITLTDGRKVTVSLTVTTVKGTRKGK